MATLPSRTILSVASAFASAVAVSGISNAAEAVVSAAAHGFANGDIVQLYSGWGRLNRRVVRVKSTAANTFVAEGIDTTSLEFFPAGSGVGTVRKITTFTQISKYLNPSTSGGDPKNVTVRFMDEDTDTSLNDGFNATTESFDIDADQFGSSAYAVLVAMTNVQIDTVLKKTLRSGATIYTPCTIALNENVKLADGSIMTNAVSVNGNGRVTRYS